MSERLRGFTCASLILLSGCTSVPMPGSETKGGATFSAPEGAPPGYATLVIYREQGPITTSFDLDFFVNDTAVAQLGRLTYTYVYIKEGLTSVRFGRIEDVEKKRTMEFKTVAGETYFLKHGMGQSLILPTPVVIVRTSINFNFVEPSAAERELSACRYIAPRVRSL